MTTGTESYDSPLKSILYAIAGVFVFSLWNDPLKLHKSEQADQSVLRGVRG